MIEHLRKNIDVSLASFLKTVKKDYKLHLASPLLFESICEFTLREGKRLRPLLLILTYKAYSPKNKAIAKELYNASTCMEFLHNFMLIHDDIIDRSNLRRRDSGEGRRISVAAGTTNVHLRGRARCEHGIRLARGHGCESWPNPAR